MSAPEVGLIGLLALVVAVSFVGLRWRIRREIEQMPEERPQLHPWVNRHGYLLRQVRR